MKIFCVGRNYAEHAKELGNAIPDEPVIFMKPKSALLQAHTPFYYPEFTNELHYECELVLRISKNGKYIQDKFASKYYDAITVGIDFTARKSCGSGTCCRCCSREGCSCKSRWQKVKRLLNSAIPLRRDFLFPELYTAIRYLWL